MPSKNRLSSIGGAAAPGGAAEEASTRLTVDLPVACLLLGIGRSLGYELVRRSQFPVPVMRLGRRVVVPVHGICIELGIKLRPGEIVTAEKLEQLVVGDQAPYPAA